MSFPEEYILSLLGEYVKGSELMSEGNVEATKFGKDEAEKLTKEIMNDFVILVSSKIHTFRKAKVYGRVSTTYRKTGQLSASISVDETSLRRESLYLTKTTHTGKGIDDILALFVHGYKIKSKWRPKGRWVHWGDSLDNFKELKIIKCLPFRRKDAFLTDFVAYINKKYAGQCVATLESPYK